MVAELGCGPDHTAVELANWVGEAGHVHALDINERFLELARANAVPGGVAVRISTHLCDGGQLPLATESLDCLATRNALIYIEEPAQTIEECRRVLKAGGVFPATEGDWPMMLVEPLAVSQWLEVITAAGDGCRTPDIGRRLYGLP